jgi:hypothetical protein
MWHMVLQFVEAILALIASSFNDMNRLTFLYSAQVNQCALKVALPS